MHPLVVHQSGERVRVGVNGNTQPLSVDVVARHRENRAVLEHRRLAPLHLRTRSRMRTEPASLEKEARLEGEVGASQCRGP